MSGVLEGYGAQPIGDLSMVDNDQKAETPEVTGVVNYKDKEKSNISPLALGPWCIPASKDIPPRKWLYGTTHLAGTVTGTAGPGGTGKSALALAEALAMTSHGDDETHSFFEKLTQQGLRVAYLNLEDDAEEQDRRAAGIVETYGLDASQIAGRLITIKDDDFGLCLTRMDGGQVIVCEDVVRLEATIKKHNLDVVIIDPFVSAHNVSENDNGAIDKTVKALGRIAMKLKVSIHVVHHVAKLRGEALTQDSARGASAFVDGLRGLRGIAQMTMNEATTAGLKSPEGYIRVKSLKANYMPTGEAEWYQLRSTELDNGDSVAVPHRWAYPGATPDLTADEVRRIALAVQAEQPVRASAQTQGQWIGTIIGDEMNWDVPDGAIKKNAQTKDQIMASKKVARVISDWNQRGLLVSSKERHPDRSGRDIPFYSVNADKIPPATT